MKIISVRIYIKKTAQRIRFTVNTCIIDWENRYALVMFTLHVHNSQLSTSSNYMNLHIVLHIFNLGKSLQTKVTT